MAPFTNSRNLRSFLDALPVGTAIIGVRGTILRWDKQSEKIFGVLEAEAIGMSIFKLFPSSQFTLEKYVAVSAASRRRIRKKVFLRHNGKSEQHIEITFKDLKQNIGEQGVMAVFRDVTKEYVTELRRKIAEEELQRSNERFRTLFELAPDVIYSVDDDGNFAELNEAFEKVTGFRRVEWIGKNYRDLTHPDDLALAKKKFKEGIGGRVSKPYVLRIRTSTGRYIFAEFISKPRKLGGKIEGKLGIFRDITERKHEELQRNYMLGIASHELRTPLASIKVFNQILERKFITQKQKEYLPYIKKIDGQIGKLTKLISDLLDIERIRAGRLEVISEIFDFDALVYEVVEELQPNYSHKLIVKGKAGKYMQGDRGRIGRVITNLITNAVKYSPGKKKVIISLNSSAKSINISIKDFGIGIPKENIDKIFEPFYHSNSEDKKKIPSVGLGLYISSELANVHKGKIWVESEVGKGSTFFLTLPIKPNLHK